MEEEKKKQLDPVELKFRRLSRGTTLYLLPCINISMDDTVPTIKAIWWVFSLEITINRHLPEWFMEQFWNTVMLKFINEGKD